MRRISNRRRQLNAQVAPYREQLRQRVGRCEFCGRRNRGLQVHEIRTEVLLERDAYSNVATRLKQSNDDLKRAIQDLGRSVPAERGPWRAEQKLAALAALFALR